MIRLYTEEVVAFNYDFEMDEVIIAGAHELLTNRLRDKAPSLEELSEMLNDEAKLEHILVEPEDEMEIDIFLAVREFVRHHLEGEDLGWGLSFAEFHVGGEYDKY